MHTYLDGLVSTYFELLQATENLSDLLDLPYWDGQQPIDEWCSAMDGLVTSPWCRARRTMLADLLTWEGQSFLSPTRQALAAVLRHGQRHVSTEHGYGLGSAYGVHRAEQAWSATDVWRDDAKPAEQGIPSILGTVGSVMESRPVVKPEVVKYRPIMCVGDRAGQEATGPMLPTSDDVPYDVIAESPVARYTRPWNPAKVVTRDDVAYVQHTDHAYSVVRSDEIKRYASRGEYVSERAKARAGQSPARARLSAERKAQREAVAAMADRLAYAITTARDARQLGDVTVNGLVVAQIRPGTRVAHVVTPEGRRLPAQRDVKQYASALATSLI